MKGNAKPQRTMSSLLWPVLLVAGLFTIAACAPKPIATSSEGESMADAKMEESMAAAKAAKDKMMMSMEAPSPDPRVGLSAGLFDAGEAVWNLEMVSTTPPPENFVGVTNSDLAFLENYVIQGNYNGIQIWDISDPKAPTIATEYVCPASQSDVSVYENLLFVSGEGLGGRLDCGTQGVEEAISGDRLRGIRIFDISDIYNPEYITNVQTCRGSHTHSLLKDPDDNDNVYVYVSGSAPVRPSEELDGCSSAMPSEDPNSALFRIEVIQVPLASPETAAIVSSPRIFNDLVAPPEHGLAPDDLAALEEARARGAFIVEFGGQEQVLPDRFATMMLNEYVSSQGKEGPPNAADSSAFREALPAIIAQRFGISNDDESDGPRPGPTQCHDITLYPAIGLAGGACEGYGLLLDISDPANPVRMDAVADSNFAYWHSATFSNDGSKILFTDEWGGGGGPKCRANDPKEWGANALFTLENGKMEFQSYFKLPAPQTPQENCVAHNGSLIPVPGRDLFVQSWYQGGISIMDWTDVKNPIEIAYHDRGPVDPDRMVMGGSWSVYWYNGLIVNSEIARGLDIFELLPSGHISENEIAAAKTVTHNFMNAQGQPIFEWPASFAFAGAYVDQLERSNGLSAAQLAGVRQALSAAEGLSGAARRTALNTLAGEVDGHISGSSDASKVEKLAGAIRALSAAS